MTRHKAITQFLLPSLPAIGGFSRFSECLPDGETTPCPLGLRLKVRSVSTPLPRTLFISLDKTENAGTSTNSPARPTHCYNEIGIVLTPIKVCDDADGKVNKFGGGVRPMLDPWRFTKQAVPMLLTFAMSGCTSYGSPQFDQNRMERELVAEIDDVLFSTHCPYRSSIFPEHGASGTNRYTYVYKGLSPKDGRAIIKTNWSLLSPHGASDDWVTLADTSKPYYLTRCGDAAWEIRFSSATDSEVNYRVVPRKPSVFE